MIEKSEAILDLMYEVFNEKLPRQGPGDNESTKKAFNYLLEISSDPLILDVGCGTGMQTLAIAKLIDGKIIAIDNHQPFLDELKKKVSFMDLNDKITIINKSMFEMDFGAKIFDIIWSEGAAYIYGFEKALEDWQVFLKDKGYLVFSELNWFKDNPPNEIVDYLISEYPPIKTIEENKVLITSKGLELISYFNLPESSWWDNYYNPLEKNIQILHIKYQKDKKSLKILEMFHSEIEMYRKYSNYYGYTFFIMRKK